MKKLLITLPCFNEEQVLEKNVNTIFNYAQKGLSDYDWSILVIDNASSDKTFEIAKKLNQQNPKILIAQYLKKGRGAALKNVWQANNCYDIYSYMDIDLATDLNHFTDLISKLDEGYNIAVGSRYVPGAKAQRSFRRKFMSKVYNLLLKLFLKVDFKDAQCGFKAFDKKSIINILPKTFDSGWFWDTEFMILAERSGYKIIEIPVVWKEVRDEIRESKVSPLAEAFKQLRNIRLMRARLKDNLE